MFGKKTLEPMAWYKQACKLRRKRKLKEPYSTLLRYYECVSWNVLHDYGHFDFFSGAKFDECLDDYVKDIRSILPQHLLDNFNAILEKYLALDEDPDYDEVEKIFDEYDDYAGDHDEEIADIIKSYITEMTERHYL